MSLRIISGERRGAKLKAPAGRETRPLRDRVREALFNILRPEIPGAVVLDAFAGTGAVGLEALSNGAGYGIFAEASQRVLPVLKENVQKLRYEKKTEILSGRMPEVLKHLRKPEAGLINLIFLMPPYQSGLGQKVLASPALRPVLGEAPLAILELHKDEPFEETPGWDLTDERLYGVTRLVFFRFSS